MHSHENPLNYESKKLKKKLNSRSFGNEGKQHINFKKKWNSKTAK